MAQHKTATHIYIHARVQEIKDRASHGLGGWGDFLAADVAELLYVNAPPHKHFRSSPIRPRKLEIYALLDLHPGFKAQVSEPDAAARQLP